MDPDPHILYQFSSCDQSGQTVRTHAVYTKTIILPETFMDVNKGKNITEGILYKDATENGENRIVSSLITHTLRQA